jgi:hypothetical protein
MSTKYYFSAEDLIESVKRRASIPNSEDLITDEEILRFANEEMDMEMCPLITMKHEDYFLTRELIQIDMTNNRYPIPYRAMGAKIRELAYQPNLSNPNDLREMRRISPNDLAAVSNRTSTSRHFYFEGENIVLWGRNESLIDGYLVVFFFMRPNSLVTFDKVAEITSFDLNAGTFQVDKIPLDFTVGSKIDFIKSQAPHKIMTYDIPILAIDADTKTITFDPSSYAPQPSMGSTMTQIAAGDQICMAGETNLINIPSELHVMLAQMAAARILDAIGDKENLQQANDKLLRMESNAQAFLDNRDEGSPYKVRPRNSLLRRRRRYRRSSL